MSTEDTVGKGDIVLSICANCGKGEEESHKLKHCNACKLVKYCNRECQIAHRPQHKKECKKKAKEVHDEKLFKQPQPLDDCPICFLRLPTLGTGQRYKSCCGKVICCGCICAPVYDNQGNEVDNQKCAFCRTSTPRSIEEAMEWLKKRMELGDPMAIYNLGLYYDQGKHGVTRDYAYAKALELFHRAAEFGYARAYNNIGYSYEIGSRGVEVDKKKARHYYELAAIGGDANARHNLGFMEKNAGNTERALKHYMIAAGAGDTDSLNNIKELYTNGDATKDDYTKALRSYQTYLGEIKSKQRDEAAADDRYRYYESGV